MDPIVTDLGTTFTANFPFGAMVDPSLRLRAAFDFFDSDLSGLELRYVGGSGADVVVSGALTASSVTPEPISLLLLSTGLIGVGVMRKRGRRSAEA